MESGLDELNATLEALGGCSDGDCKVYVRPGMHTNGGCRCLRDDKYKAERVISAYRRYVRFAEATRAPSDAALVEALEDVTAHLAAAISLLSRSPKTGAASNKMFDQMLIDYDNSAARGRAALAAVKGQQP